MKTNTPICDFAKKYAKKRPVRLHVPGHKGVRFLGLEKYDLTEIDGADSLFNANGIIAQSEQVASTLFNCPTFYSTEGSSLAIRSMVYLASLYAKSKGQNPLILSTKNAHKSFLTAVGLLDVKVEWIDCQNGDFLTQNLTAFELENYLANCINKPTALYITSPDYFGNIADVSGLSSVCRKHGVLLLVDCAHGAYLKFLPQSAFPIDLGADMCATSAHKTLPCITGGAYLHLNKCLPEHIISKAKSCASVFASTSPSYLILQSLDYCNHIVSKQFNQKLNDALKPINSLKNALINHGYTLVGNEPLKITIDLSETTITGDVLASYLKTQAVYVEFYDADYLVMMFSPYLKNKQLKKLQNALLCVTLKKTQKRLPPKRTPKTTALPISQVLMANTESISVSQALGRIYAQIDLPCPPAVPILAWGEVIDQNAIDIFNYYGITNCMVVK